MVKVEVRQKWGKGALHTRRHPEFPRGSHLVWVAFDGLIFEIWRVRPYWHKDRRFLKGGYVALCRGEHLKRMYQRNCYHPIPDQDAKDLIGDMRYKQSKPGDIWEVELQVKSVRS